MGMIIAHYVPFGGGKLSENLFRLLASALLEHALLPEVAQEHDGALHLVRVFRQAGGGGLRSS
jgi:hypothetical protein